MSKETPSSIRIRENQRRSRARRKDLIKDLQNRVQEYELKGAVATQEMQQAARKVAQENSRLRSLLAFHGISQEEVTSYLRSFEEAGVPDRSSIIKVPDPLQNRVPKSMSSSQLSITRPCSHARPLRGTDQRFPRDREDSMTQQRKSEEPHVSLRTRTGLSPSRAIGSYINDQGTRGADDSDYASPFEEHSECPNSSNCFCPSTITARDQPPSPGLEISCETAATIIADMRGDGDRDLVRASLGCSGSEDCRVKNSSVLQIMDET